MSNLADLALHLCRIIRLRVDGDRNFNIIVIHDYSRPDVASYVTLCMAIGAAGDMAATSDVSISETVLGLCDPLILSRTME